MTKRSILIVAVTLAAACSRGGSNAAAPVPVDGFASAITAADKRVEAGDYSGADRILADYALKNKGTENAVEIAFFRALFMIDPNNRNASMAEGVRALDIYLNTTSAKRYRPEALVLRRTAQAVLALRNTAAATTSRSSKSDTVYVNREAEIAELKDQLSKANAELERIKKRLANPKS
ncbi:MAG TPA: hypothetical protein VF042_08820 [Gemmatimonadaceae bacterium]